MRKINALPIGYSDVRKVIHTGYYVDKTQYAQELIERGNPIFIARPRRFGKSLFIDTIATICKGEKEVFKDCYIGKPENGYEWKQYPLLRLDFSRLMNDSPELLQLSLEDLLTRIASLYKLTITGQVLKTKLASLVEDMTTLGNYYEPEIVVLIDEYDAPIVNLTKGSDLEQANIKVMKDFFMTLKSLNSYFKLTFITGVSKFGLSDVFSGANHLDDITISQNADAMFRYTQEEILSAFSDKIDGISLEWSKKDRKQITDLEVMRRIATYYNGYRFHKDGVSVYNPWSTLNF